MDIHQAKLDHEKCELNERKALDYYDAITKAAAAEVNLGILMAAKMPELRKKRSNIGWDMGLVELLALDNSPMIKKEYTDYKVETAKAKGLDRIIQTNQATVSHSQSMMKYQKENE